MSRKFLAREGVGVGSGLGLGLGLSYDLERALTPKSLRTVPQERTIFEKSLSFGVSSCREGMVVVWAQPC
jgi:hypothetical protein